MRKISLRNKLMAGALALVLFVMLSTTLVVSFMVARQNRAASFTTVARSLAIVDNDLAEQEAGLLEQIGQTITAGELGEYIKYIGKNQSIGDGGNDLLRHEYERIVDNLENLAVLGKLRRIAAYSSDGGLIAFIAENDGGRLAGYHTGADYRVDSGESQDEWKKTRDDPGLGMGAVFDGTMPDVPVIEYRTIAGELCVTALIPTTASEYDVKTETLRQERSGVVVAVRHLNGAFAEKIARLTGTEVGVFAGETRTAGTLDEYRTLRAEEAVRKTVDVGSRNRDILLNEISLEEGRYFQGVLPLTSDGITVGSISLLYSRAVAAANTAQIVKIIAVTAIVLLIIILPVTLILANSLARPVRRVIDTLDSTAHEVNDGSVHVSTSSHQLAEGASEQASSIEETSASLEELSSMTKQNADNARQADALMSEAAGVVSEVGGKLEKMTGAIREIGVNSDETHKIIKTIDEIAFQTNLLALNAAVEAARAGEAGAGFAVVAEEVRNLAIRSAEAAKNTGELIETTVKSVREGERLNGETNEAFERNAEISAKIRDLIGEIAAASQEQAQGIEQINRAMAEMDRVTQQTAANAEESASASEEMSAQATGLQSIVGDLVLLVEGANGAYSENGGKRAGHSDAARRQGNSKVDGTPLLEASKRHEYSHKESGSGKRS